MQSLATAGLQWSLSSHNTVTCDNQDSRQPVASEETDGVQSSRRGSSATASASDMTTPTTTTPGSPTSPVRQPAADASFAAFLTRYNGNQGPSRASAAAATSSAARLANMHQHILPAQDNNQIYTTAGC